MTVIWIVLAVIVILVTAAVLSFNGLVRRAIEPKRRGRRSTSSSSAVR